MIGGRLGAAAVAAVAIGAAVAAPPAAAQAAPPAAAQGAPQAGAPGAFRFSQCGAADTDGAPRRVQAGLWSVTGGWAASNCGSWGGALWFDTANHRLLDRQSVTATLSLPPSMPATSLRTAWLDWTALPQAPSVNPAYLSIWADGVRLLAAPSGAGTSPGAPERRDLPAGSRSLQFQVWCSPLNGPGACWWPGRLFEIRALTLELEEHGDPAVAGAGALLGGGPQSGVRPVAISASDADSGIRQLALSLDGVPVGQVDLAATCFDDDLPPCPQVVQRIVDVDTRLVGDGQRRLRVQATDAAGNTTAVDAGAVLIANRPPTPAPPPSPTPAPGPPRSPSPPAAPPAGPPATPPAAPHPTPGPARRPNGRNASARAHVSGWLEQAGLRVRTARGGARDRVRVRGRLTDEHGRPIAWAAVALVERRGPLVRRAARLRTGPDGRLTTVVRIGPSRSLRLVYYPFADSTRARTGPLLRLRVRAPRPARSSRRRPARW